MTFNILELGELSGALLIIFTSTIVYAICYSIYYIIFIQGLYLLYFLLFLFLSKMIIYIIYPDNFYYEFGTFLFKIGEYNLAKKHLENLDNENAIFKSAYIIYKKTNLDNSYNYILDKIRNYEMNEKINKLNKIAYELNNLNNTNNTNNNIILSEDKLFELSEKIIKYILELKGINLEDIYSINRFVNSLYNSNIAKLYYLYGISLNNSYSMTNYAIILKNENNTDIKKLKYYLLKAIEMNNSKAMIIYADFIFNYEYNNEYNKAIDYYLKSIELNNSEALDKFLHLNINNYTKYMKLKTIKSEQAKIGLSILEKDIEVMTKKMKI